MATDASWTTIESDPGVFTELIQTMGVSEVQVEELYTLDPDQLSLLKPVYGLIFLFKWKPGDTQEEKTVSDAPGVYFARQVINNACATVAMLAILMNQGDDVSIGDDLKNLRDFTADFPAELKGITISNADNIRLAHNSFAPPEACIAEKQSKAATEDDDAFHYISYVHRDGAIWELDGLQQGPIKHAECSHEMWLEVICPIISQRIATYSQKEIRFCLMALVKDRRAMLRTQMDELQSRMESENSDEIGSSFCQVRMDLEAEEQKHKTWADENIRRKHNYIPFIFNFLKLLAEKNELEPLIADAKRKQAGGPAP